MESLDSNTAREVVRPALQKLFVGGHLSRAESRTLFDAVAEGRLSEVETAALLAALKVKGEQVDELAGAAASLRAAAVPFPRPDTLFVDIVGTGGDNAGTINLSTAAAFVAATAGLPVAKHGNRSVSSRCGSADLLEACGATLELPPARMRAILDATGLGFLLAPAYHPGIRRVMPVRRQLGVRTIFNLLGPLLNPARPSRILVGVSEPALCERVAGALAALGTERALVVHGSGLDEIALHGPTQAVLLEDGALHPVLLRPADFGERDHPLEALRGGSPTENAAIFRDILAGKGSEAQNAAVAVNAGALLWLADRVDSLQDGSRMARAVLASGACLRRLQRFVEETRRERAC